MKVCSSHRMIANDTLSDCHSELLEERNNPTSTCWGNLYAFRMSWVIFKHFSSTRPLLTVFVTGRQKSTFFWADAPFSAKFEAQLQIRQKRHWSPQDIGRRGGLKVQKSVVVEHLPDGVGRGRDQGGSELIEWVWSILIFYFLIVGPHFLLFLSILDLLGKFSVFTLDLNF